MQKTALLGLTLLSLALPACHPSTNRDVAHTDTVRLQDSSLVAPPIADTPTALPDTAFQARDTVRVQEQQLLGAWSRPVQGKENEIEGFELKKNGHIRNLRTTPYTMVYDSWVLQTDSLILKSHLQQVAGPVEEIDTALVIGISDTALVLFPIRAAAGYEERYTRVGHRK